MTFPCGSASASLAAGPLDASGRSCLHSAAAQYPGCWGDGLVSMAAQRLSPGKTTTGSSRGNEGPFYLISPPPLLLLKAELPGPKVTDPRG